MSESPTPLRVLLVDDHPDIRGMVVMALEWRGHSVQAAESVASALALAALHPFDMVVSDWSLPDGTGADLMKELKAKYQLRGVVLTAYTPEQIGDKWQNAGFEGVVPKFSDLETISKTVEDIAQHKPIDNPNA